MLLLPIRRSPLKIRLCCCQCRSINSSLPTISFGAICPPGLPLNSSCLNLKLSILSFHSLSGWEALFQSRFSSWQRRIKVFTATGLQLINLETEERDTSKRSARERCVNCLIARDSSTFGVHLLFNCKELRVILLY